MSKIKEYSGKIVYIGIDVHKNTYSVAAICEGVVVKKPFTQRASPALLATSLQRMFAGADIRAVYEAGFSGFCLQRFLEEKGIKCFVVDPGTVEKSPKAIAKTDKIDSLMLASHLAAGRLRFVRIPSLEEEFDRLVTRTREQLVETRTGICNQIKSRLLQFGHLKADENWAMSEKRLAALAASKEIPAPLKEILAKLGKAWSCVNSEIRAIEAEIRAKTDVNSTKIDKVMATYESAPGFGLVSARTMAAELGDMSQFATAKQLYSFVGLTPTEHSSGGHRRLGNISRRGPWRIRRILVEIAWRAIKKDVGLAHLFDRIAARRGKLKAITAVARNILGRLRACFNNKQHYELGFFEGKKLAEAA